MIIYGTRGVHLGTKDQPTQECPNCNSKDALQIHMFGKHFHIFWIPVFPYRKKGIIECTNCKAQFEPKEVPQILKTYTNAFKSETKYKIYQFAGLMLFAILMGLGFIQSSLDEDQELTYLEQPAIGDIYEYKTGDGYSIMKVVDVEHDSIQVKYNLYSINKLTKTHTLDKVDNYESDIYSLHKNTIDSLYHSGNIYNIKR